MSLYMYSYCECIYIVTYGTFPVSTTGVKSKACKKGPLSVLVLFCRFYKQKLFPIACKED